MGCMKLVEYTRVSGKGQVKDGYGLAIQHKDSQAWAKEAGHRIVLHCTDDGLSGTLGSDVVEGIGINGEHLADRPGLQEAIAAVQDGTADGIICGKLDRLGRATHVQEAVLAMVWRAGGHVFAADQGEVLKDDPDDPMRTAMRKIMQVFDELDKAIAVQRMRKGREAKAAAGRHAVGTYPYGYRAGGEGRDRDAVPDQAEQRALRIIWQLHHNRDDVSYRQIAATLDRMGVPPRSGKRWYPSTVRKIALRLELTGLETDERAQHEAIAALEALELHEAIEALERERG
jgi:DNA invertase Pin-like site-specific DNA recombinase